MSVHPALQARLVTLLHQLHKGVAERPLAGGDLLSVGCSVQGVQRSVVQLLKTLRHLMHQDIPVHHALLKGVHTVPTPQDSVRRRPLAPLKPGANHSPPRHQKWPDPLRGSSDTIGG